LDFLYFGEDNEGAEVATALASISVVGPSAVPSEEVLEGYDLWIKHDWVMSLGCYLWSMRNEFVDHGRDYDTLRVQALNQLLAREPLPLPRPVTTDEATQLPAPAELPSGPSVGDVLARRRTATRFRQMPLPGEVFSGLLHHGFRHSRRFHVPDVAGDVRNILQGCGFAVDPYVAAYNVEGLQPGIYRYSVFDDRLALLSPGCFRSQISHALIGHHEAKTASFTVLLVAEFERFQWRYRHERAIRNLFVDVGRMAQFFILVATAYDLACHLTPACRDASMSKLLNLDPNRQQVLHTVTVGRRI
jgi:SagB-type dehydrogenase family enzyme